MNKNAISVDVEDYFQVSAFEHHINREDWDSLEHRVERNTQKLLQVFDDANVKATFFTLGWVAERYPQVVKSMVENGHEVASHGYGHQRVSDLSPEAFRSDIVKAKNILEDLTGQSIKGYRAPSYSINHKNLWALEILAETGHEYSSSIYPIKHDHYGFPSAPRFVFRDEKSGIVEIPITTVRLFNQARPAGGGGFFRLLPYAFSKWLINRVNQQDKRSTVFYLHPWEIDPDQPRQHGAPLKSRFRHYLNLNKTEGRLTRLLSDFNWAPMHDVFLNDAENIPTVRLV